MGKKYGFKHQDLQMLRLELNKYFHSHDVVGRGSETQLLVGENLDYLI